MENENCEGGIVYDILTIKESLLELGGYDWASRNFVDWVAHKFQLLNEK